MANISEINAMDTTEWENIFSKNKKLKINELAIENTRDERENIINKLLLEPSSSVLKEDIYNIKAIKNYFNTGYVFGDEKSNHRSLYNWIVYTRSLYALEILGEKEEGIKLKEEFGRAKRRLKMIDFYTDGKDYKYCLSGIWCIVSTFDKEERKNLLEALKKGEEIPKDDRLINFFESF